LPMLESLNLKKKLAKAAYDRAMPQLQDKLRRLQYEARATGIATIICLEGWEMSERGEVVQSLTEELDPRLIRVFRGLPPTLFEQRYHFLWRYEIALPSYGEMAVFDHSWYSRVLDDRCDKAVKKRVWQQAYPQIAQFERWLTDDGQVVIKFWLHISKKEQKKRIRKTLRDPLLRWKVTKDTKRQHKRYSKWVVAVDEMVVKTNAAHAPWTLVEANDSHWARVRVFRTVIGRLEKALAQRRAREEKLARAAKAKKTAAAKGAAPGKEEYGPVPVAAKGAA
jgi:AMP-polyphosphate phosphotransferase